MPTGELLTQTLCQIKQPSLLTFTCRGHCGSAISVSCCLKRDQWSIQGGGDFNLAEQYNRFFETVSEEAYQSDRDHTGRLESGCVRVAILSITIEGLLCLLPPCTTIAQIRRLCFILCTFDSYCTSSPMKTSTRKSTNKPVFYKNIKSHHWILLHFMRDLTSCSNNYSMCLESLSQGLKLSMLKIVCCVVRYIFHLL